MTLLKKYLRAFLAAMKAFVLWPYAKIRAYIPLIKTWLYKTWKNSTPRQKQIGGAGLVIVLLLVLFLGGDDKPDLWQETTTPYDPTCEKNCEEIPISRMHHIGDMKYYFQPGVDDAISQWASCLDSVMFCIMDPDKEDTGLIEACVSKADCPEPCKTEFQKASAQTAKNFESQRQIFEDIFVNETGFCVPEGADG